MTPVLLALGVALAGGVGAACRMLLDGIVKQRARLPLPLGTMLVNVTGSFLLGAVTGLAAELGPWALILGTGMLGGYTTFSTASYETVRLAQEGRWRAALVNGFGMLLLALVAAWLGLSLAALLP